MVVVRSVSLLRNCVCFSNVVLCLCQMCDHIITLDLDTLIHTTKLSGQKHHCYVYRLNRSLPDEDIIKPPPTKRRCRRRLRSAEDLNSSTSLLFDLQN